MKKNCAQLILLLFLFSCSNSGCRNAAYKNEPGIKDNSASKANAGSSSANSHKKFLFDAAHGETAGNADWVIDEDNFVPGGIPTPPQSNITDVAPETFWTGALSSWGIALVNTGNEVETLPAVTKFSFGKKEKQQDLSHYDVLVVDEPNIRFTDGEKEAILNFVNNGGGLFMISDHTKSDRNNDGWDSPDIWNDLMENNSIKKDPFGFSIDLTNITQRSNNVLADDNDVILNGLAGKVTQLDFHNGATISINKSANSNVKGLIWQNGVEQNDSHIMCASSTYGKGRLFVVTDSSPMDDGTGAPGNKLYVSWDRFSHTQLFMNASLWLAKLQ